MKPKSLSLLLFTYYIIIALALSEFLGFRRFYVKPHRFDMVDSRPLHENNRLITPPQVDQLVLHFVNFEPAWELYSVSQHSE